MQKTGNEAIAPTILGIIGMVFVVGLLSLGFSIYYYVALRDNLSDIDEEFFSASLGAGIYMKRINGPLAAGPTRR